MKTISSFFLHTVFCGLLVSVHAGDTLAQNLVLKYATDFSSDPAWVTDQAENYYWDSESETYHARTENSPPGPPPTRFAYTTVDYQGGAFLVEFDTRPIDIQWSAGVGFGLYDSTFTTWEGGPPNAQFAHVFIGAADAGVALQVTARGNNGLFRYDQDWNLLSNGTWYRFRFEYDSKADILTMTASVRDTAAIVTVQQVDGLGGFSSSLNRLGFARDPIGECCHTGCSGFGCWANATIAIDNVTFYSADDCLRPSGLLLYQPSYPSQEFYIRALLTGEETTVPLPPAELGYWNPQWCSTGEWIVFGCADIAHQSHICVSRPDGSGFTKLTSGGGNYVMPDFSPDCSQIVFHGVYGQTYVINRDGTNWIDLGVALGHTRWSPVDNRIIGTNWGFTYESDIFIFDMDQATTSQVTHHIPGYRFNYADWSPDGTKLAAQGGASNATYDVYVVNVDGSNLQNLTADLTDSDEVHPSWSSDGQFIFFSRLGSEMSQDVWAMRDNGTGRINLTNTPDVDELDPDILGGNWIMDCDGDGVPNSDDKCPNTDPNEPLVINGCETRIDYYLFEYGCSMLDLVEDCEAQASNHGQFVRCVGALARDWREAGLISALERARIVRCAAGSRAPRGPKAMTHVPGNDGSPR